jgi:hypothetical protein
MLLLLLLLLLLSGLQVYADAAAVSSLLISSFATTMPMLMATPKNHNLRLPVDVDDPDCKLGALSRSSKAIANKRTRIMR